MPIKTITFNGVEYPEFQAKGNAAKWVREIALEVCKPTGKEIGFDIGCNRPEWCLPGAIPIDPVIDEWDAYRLPIDKVDYIHSSHCCEHLPDWVKAIDYWATKLHSAGVLFLYLPDMSVQEYWRPQNNRKHLHYLTPEILRQYFENRKQVWGNVFVSSWDINYSFTVLAHKL